MPAVGLSGLFKYGFRFLAHLLVVVLLGLVLILIGDVVGEFLIGSISDPGVRTPPETIGWAGVAIAVTGVLVTVAGLGGLLFKLVADGTAAGATAVTVGETPVAGDATGSNGESDTDETTTADTSSSPQTTGDEPDEGSPEREPEPQQPTPSAGTSSSSPDDRSIAETSEPSPPPDPPSSTRVATTETDTDSPPDTIDTERTPPVDDEQVTGSSEAEDAAESVDPAPSGPQESPEWTPPDPEEFERQQAERADSTDTEPADHPTDSGQSSSADGTGYDDGTRIVDENDLETSDDSATTWDDLQEAAGSGQNQSGASDTGTPDSDGPPADEWAPPDEFDGAPDQEGESADEYADIDESDDESEVSFETDGDSDPLSDALSDE